MRDESRSQNPLATSSDLSFILRVMRDHWPVMSKGVARTDWLIRRDYSGSDRESQGSAGMPIRRPLRQPRYKVICARLRVTEAMKKVLE